MGACSPEEEAGLRAISLPGPDTDTAAEDPGGGSGRGIPVRGGARNQLRMYLTMAVAAAACSCWLTFHLVR